MPQLQNEEPTEIVENKAALIFCEIEDNLHFKEGGIKEIQFVELNKKLVISHSACHTHELFMKINVIEN
ncbi:hypothetical protein BpHYR1_035063 [Brachionus plicatilis]|uniref:Uncharacterized protein n=1 Tax=Brachionus plicatilis TaxID=10195 RepID=A0A3M7SZ15_BRAPC|nr:hypothetical protein BpHYR1_035063 [Brachionus plicatilis]